MINRQSVFDYILSEESSYQTLGVPIVDQWDFRMHQHIQLSTLYKYGQLSTGKTDDKPVKNIVKPVLNVARRSEGFDVKDIEPYVNDQDNHFKSFLVRKFHDKWARKWGIDTVIDESMDSFIDYGLTLVKDVNETRPEAVPLQRIAFCDQTDILSGPICEKHMYSVDALIDMKGKWESDAIDEAISLAEEEKTNSQANNRDQKTPGRYIEVYELHGVLPKAWLNDDEEDQVSENDSPFVRQAQYIVFPNKTTKDNKQGIVLWKGKEKESIYKAKKRDPIYGRACGHGGVEELFEAQIWTNYNLIQQKDILDAVALMLVHTTDETFEQGAKTSGFAKNEIVTTKEGTTFEFKTPNGSNMQLFQNAVAEWENHARTTGSASDPQLGNSPSAGTPFALQELVVQQGQGIHEYRQGQLASFWGEIYSDWVLKHLVKDMMKGDKWVEELSLDELQWVAEKVTTKAVNTKIKQMILDGQEPTEDMRLAITKLFHEDFVKSGNKKFMEIFKDEMRGLPIEVAINIKGKQKNLAGMTDKIVNIVRQVLANPQVLQVKGLAKAFNEILEFSGLSQVDFSTVSEDLAKIAPAQPVQAPAQLQAPQQQPVAA